MRSRIVLALVAVAIVPTVVVARANGAGAKSGGWAFDRPFYEPGDRVVAAESVAWEYDAKLGTPENGPYGLWVIRADGDASLGMVPSLAEQIEQARYVGDLRIELGGGEINGLRYGPNVVRAAFTLPLLEPGPYWLVHCNYPCTTKLGDLGEGFFWVGPPEPNRRPTNGHPDPRPSPPSASPKPVQPAQPAPRTEIAGYLVLGAKEHWSRVGERGCRGSGLYADVRARTPVEVADASAVPLAHSHLARGSRTDEGCSFFFVVRVPPAGLYTFQVGRDASVFQKSYDRAGLLAVGNRVNLVVP